MLFLSQVCVGQGRHRINQGLQDRSKARAISVVSDWPYLPGMVVWLVCIGWSCWFAANRLLNQEPAGASHDPQTEYFKQIAKLQSEKVTWKSQTSSNLFTCAQTPPTPTNTTCRMQHTTSSAGYVHPQYFELLISVLTLCTVPRDNFKTKLFPETIYQALKLSPQTERQL
jgi:hypothetical protein